MCLRQKSDEKFSILTSLWIKTNIAYTRLYVIAKQRSGVQVYHRRQIDMLNHIIAYSIELILQT